MDIVPQFDGVVVLGNGWHPLESFEGKHFRWVTNDAELYVPTFTAAAHHLTLDLEPGPGVGTEALALKFRDEANNLLGRCEVPDRELVSLILSPSPPMMHCVRLHASNGGKAIATDARILNFRVFGIVVVSLRRDIVQVDAGVKLTSNWYQLEEVHGEAYRWVNNDAAIEIVDPTITSVELDIEPGPGAGGAGLALDAIETSHDMTTACHIQGRSCVAIALPGETGSPRRILLHTGGGGSAVVGEARTLNFRVFNVRPVRGTLLLGEG